MLRINQLFIVYFFLIFNIVAMEQPISIEESKTPLTIYTVKSVLSKDYGFAEELSKKFEEKYNIQLRFIPFNSSADMLVRLKLEGEKTKADMVLGLDYYHLEDAKALDLFADHNLDFEQTRIRFPILWGEEQFLPYEYGYLGFLYKKDQIAHPPKNFKELIESKDIKLIISSPYTSIPGFGMVLWLKEIYGSQAAKIWHQLKPHIVSITTTWSQAYALFHEGEANMMLSFTNDAHHLNKLNKKGFGMALFEEGQYLQSSLMGVLRTTRKPELCFKFLKIMLDPQIQKIAAKKTWMYPVVEIADEDFNYPTIETTRTINPKVAAMNRRPWVKEWRMALSKSRA